MLYGFFYIYNCQRRDYNTFYAKVKLVAFSYGSLTVIIEKNSKSIDRCFIFLSTFLLFYIVFFRILCYNIYIFWRSFMRINISKSKNHEFIYIIRDIYNNGSRTTKIHKKLGKIEDLCSEKKYVQR